MRTRSGFVNMLVVRKTSRVSHNHTHPPPSAGLHRARLNMFPLGMCMNAMSKILLSRTINAAIQGPFKPRCSRSATRCQDQPDRGRVDRIATRVLRAFQVVGGQGNYPINMAMQRTLDMRLRIVCQEMCMRGFIPSNQEVIGGDYDVPVNVLWAWELQEHFG